MKKENLHPSVIRLKPATWAELEKLAKKQDRTVSYIMRQILERETKTNTPR